MNIDNIAYLVLSKRGKRKARIIQGVNVTLYIMYLVLYLYKGIICLPVSVNYTVLNYFLRRIW